MVQLATSLWFDGKAEEAAKLYTSLFEDGRILRTSFYSKEGFEFHGQPEGSVLSVEFEFCGQKYTAINGGPIFKFNEAMSIMVLCDTQEEIDYYWSKLAANGGEEGPCGWLKDKYGLSWQIAPAILGDMLCDADSQKRERVTKAYMQMKKFDIQVIKDAYAGKF